MRSRNLDIFFTISRCAGGTHVLVRVASGADDWRVTHPPRDLPCESAGGGTTGDFAFFVQSRTVNGSGWRENHVANGFHAKLRRNPDFGRGFFHAADTEAPVAGVVRTRETTAPAGIIETRPPPIRVSLFP